MVLYLERVLEAGEKIALKTNPGALVSQETSDDNARRSRWLT